MQCRRAIGMARMVQSSSGERLGAGDGMSQVNSRVLGMWYHRNEK